MPKLRLPECGHDLLYSFDIEIAGQIRRKPSRPFASEKAQATTCLISQVARVNTETLKAGGARRSR